MANGNLLKPRDGAKGDEVVEVEIVAGVHPKAQFLGGLRGRAKGGEARLRGGPSGVRRP